MKAPAKAELELMLPGFRFLFAAILLSMSILIFGLGAAALLRAAHEEVASIPSRRTLPEPVFAQSEGPAPTLALLRVEPPVVAKAPESAPAAAPAERAPEAVPVPPVETERLAALKIEDSAPSETTKPEVPAPESAPSTEVAQIRAEAPASTDEIKIAAVAQTPPPAMTEAAPADLEPVIVPPAPESIGAATRIATLGRPAVIVKEPTSVKPASAQSDRSAARKKLRAQRAKERRRLAAQRARQQAQQAAAAQQQQQTDPFGSQQQQQPIVTTTRKR